MIYLKIMGGLGNQMFQYAIARTLAKKHDTEIVIDRSLCVESESVNSEGLSLRPFDLDIFNINAKLDEPDHVDRSIKVRKEAKVKRFFVLLMTKVTCNLLPWKIRIYERKSVGFDKTLLQLPDEVVLQGYFPSFKYSQQIEEILRKEFSFKPAISEENQVILDKINSSNSISLHLRRGDYLSNKKTREEFGPCSLSYYQKAIEYFADTVENPEFFIFTNDHEYAKNNLKIEYPTTFITHNTGPQSYEDLRLMSLCKHNIIANSSFSWWGAWLNDSDNKIVVAPTPAFDKLDIKDSDFYPSSWILINK